MYENKTDFKKLGLLHKEKMEIEKIKDEKLVRWCQLNDNRAIEGIGGKHGKS